MSVINAFVLGWRQLITQRKAWIIIYCCNLIFAVIAVVPIQSWIKEAAGYSIALTQSIGDFDFTFIGDLLRNYGSGSMAMLSIVCVIVICYLVLNAFLSGGVLHHFVHREHGFSRSEFVAGGMRYFWRLTGMAFLFLVFHVILLGMLAAVFLAIGINPFHMENDVQFVRTARFVLAVYGMALLLVLLIHAYAKICLVEAQDRGVFGAIKRGAAFVMRRFISAVALFLLLIGLLIGLLLIAGYLKSAIPSTTLTGILLFLFLSQLAVVGRIGIRLLVLSSGVQLRIKN